MPIRIPNQGLQNRQRIDIKQRVKTLAQKRRIYTQPIYSTHIKSKRFYKII